MLAGRLLDKFGSIERIFSASEEELSSVEGIGSKKAKEIRGVIDQDLELRPEFIEKMMEREKEPAIKIKDFKKHFGLNDKEQL